MNSSDPSPVDLARQIIDDLHQKRDATQDRQASLGNERKSLAYSAATGDKDAAAKLARLNTEATGLAIEAENLTSAITEAEARLEAAQEAEAEAEKRGRAEQALLLIMQFREKMAALDGQSIALAEAFRDCLRLGWQISELAGGPGGPIDHGLSQHLLALNAQKALAVHFAGVLDIGMVPPSERLSLAELGTRSAALTETWAQRTLGQAEEDTAVEPVADGEAEEAA